MACLLLKMNFQKIIAEHHWFATVTDQGNKSQLSGFLNEKNGLYMYSKISILLKFTSHWYRYFSSLKWETKLRITCRSSDFKNLHFSARVVKPWLEILEHQIKLSFSRFGKPTERANSPASDRHEDSNAPSAPVLSVAWYGKRMASLRRLLRCINIPNKIMKYLCDALIQFDPWFINFIKLNLQLERTVELISTPQDIYFLTKWRRQQQQQKRKRKKKKLMNR